MTERLDIARKAALRSDALARKYRPLPAAVWSSLTPTAHRMYLELSRLVDPEGFVSVPVAKMASLDTFLGGLVGVRDRQARASRQHLQTVGLLHVGPVSKGPRTRLLFLPKHQTVEASVLRDLVRGAERLQPVAQPSVRVARKRETTRIRRFG